MALKFERNRLAGDRFLDTGRNKVDSRKRSISGNQPVPATSRSASPAISAFLSFASRPMSAGANATIGMPRNVRAQVSEFSGGTEQHPLHPKTTGKEAGVEEKNISEHPYILTIERILTMQPNMTPDEQQALTAWETVHIGAGGLGTSDWPGWAAVAARLSH